MYFVTCFNNGWMQNLRVFAGIDPPQLDVTGRVSYAREAHRCFGYFESKADAVAAVLENACDIHEFLYSWCVVEHLSPGIHALDGPDDQAWFRWHGPTDDCEGRWLMADRPVETLRTLNFSLG